MNCIKLSTLKTIPGETIIEDNKTEFYTAGKDTMQTLGTCELQFRIGDYQTTQTFHIIPQLSQNMILGTPFLKSAGAKMDFQSSTISFEPHHEIQAISEVTITPTQSAIMQCQLLGEELPNGLTMLIPHTAKDELEINRSVVTAINNRVPLCITNNSDHDITISPGETLTRILPLSADQCPTNEIQMNDDLGQCTHTNTPTQIQHVKSVHSTPQDIQNHLFKEYQITVPRLENQQDTDKLQQILYENRDAYIDSTGQLGFNSTITHKINMKSDVPPIAKQPFRMAPHIKEALDKQVKKLLKMNVIAEQESSWASPLIAIKKQSPKSQRHMNSDKTPEYRLCIDLRYVNANSIPTISHINNVQDMLDAIGQQKAHFFSSLDLKSAFFQQGLSPESRQYCAFLWNRKSYVWLAAPQGLASSPYYFQRLMNHVLDKQLQTGKVFCYIDDILVVTNSLSEHLEILADTLKAIKAANLKLCGKKCTYVQSEIEFLGFNINHEGITLATKHVQAIREYPQPKSKKQVKTYLGLLSYFRKWLPHRGKLIAPLTDLTKKDATFSWTPEHQACFEQINSILTSEPILKFPDFSKEFIVITGASSIAIGAVLCQTYDGEDLPVAFAGRSTTCAEKNYSATDIEALAVVYAAKTFHPYLQTKPFTILTDHNALLRIFKGNAELSGKLARYSMLLNEYQFDIKHLRGKYNLVADALSRTAHSSNHSPADCDIEDFPSYITAVTRQQSRRDAEREKEISAKPQDPESNESSTSISDPQSPENTGEEASDHTPSNSESAQSSKDISDPDLPTEVLSRTDGSDSQEDGHKTLTKGDTENVDIQHLLPRAPFTLEVLRAAQIEEEFCNDLINYLDHDKMPPTLERERKCVQREMNYCTQQGILMHITNPNSGRTASSLHFVVPIPLQKKLIRFYHEGDLSPHLGIDKTAEIIRERFSFRRLYEQVREIVGACDICLRVKPATRVANRTPTLYETTEDVFQRCHSDFAGPLTPTRDGNRYICVTVDSCSGYVVTWATRTLSAEQFARDFWKNIVTVYGAPIKLVTDNGTSFRAELWQNVSKALGINMTYVSPYSPQSNGRAEAGVKSVLQILRCMCLESPHDWDFLLHSATYAINNSINCTTSLTPYNIVFGRSGRSMISPEFEIKDNTSLSEILQSMLTTQQKAIKTATDLQLQRSKERLKRKPEEKGTDELIPGCVVYWNKPNVKPVSGKLSAKHFGPFILVSRSKFTAKLRHLHTGQFVQYSVNLNQLILARHMNSEEANMKPQFSEDRVYRAKANQRDNRENDED